MKPTRRGCSDQRKIWAFQCHSVMTLFLAPLLMSWVFLFGEKNSKKEEMVYTYTVFSCISLLPCQTCDPWLAFSRQKKSSPGIKGSEWTKASAGPSGGKWTHSRISDTAVTHTLPSHATDVHYWRYLPEMAELFEVLQFGATTFKISAGTTFKFST